MALKLTITETVKTKVQGGVIKSVAPTEVEMSQDFYCRVNKIYGSKHLVMFTLAYLSEDGVNDDPDSMMYGEPIRGQSYMHGKEFSFVPDNSDGAPNWLAQAYAYLKTLPEFADAVDA